MKFLKNTVTDLCVNTRFLAVNGSPEHGEQFIENKEEIVVKTKCALKNLRDCVPKTGQWSTAKQNEVAANIPKGPSHVVQAGDTLGSIVKGLVGKVDYSRPVFYLSNRITENARTRWNKDSDCFDIPDTLGIQKEQMFSLGVVNLIYPGQIVSIRTGDDGKEYIYVEDGTGTVPVSKPKETSAPAPEAEKPELDPKKEEKEEKEKEEKPKKECRKFPQGKETKDPCLTPEQIWTGLEGGEEAAVELFEEFSGQQVENIEAARSAFLKLYGERENGKDGMKGVEKDGVYIVMEKYFNPRFKDGVWGSLKELFTNHSLADELVDSGYKRLEAKQIQETLAGQLEGIVTVEKNINEKLKDQNDGAMRDFFLRTATGAAIALAFAPIVGISVPILLSGMPLFKVRGGIKSFTQFPDVDTIYATLSDPNITRGDLIRIGDEWQETNEPKTYLETQRTALAGVKAQNFLGYDGLDSFMVIVGGMNPDFDKAVADGLISTEDLQEYNAQRTRSKEIEEKNAKMLSSLAKNGYYFAEGAEKQATDASNGGEFELDDGWFISDWWEYTDKDQFEDILEIAKQAFDPEIKQEKYTLAMDMLVEQFNIKGQEMLGDVWEKELTMTSLDEAFQYGHEFSLGTLERNDEYPLVRELFVRFIPTTSGQPVNKGADGRWEMYIKENGKEVPVSRQEYRTARELIGKKPKHFTIDDIAKLGYSADRYTDEERDSLVDKLNKFDLIIGQLSQLKEAKDQMALTVWNTEAIDETARQNNLLDTQMSEDGTRTETTERKQYRIAIASKLAKYGTWEKFEPIATRAFSPEVQKKIKAVYDKKEGSMNVLIEDKNFQEQITNFACLMRKAEQFATIKDLNECAEFVKNDMYLSGKTAVYNSNYHTFTFGDAYLAYMLGKGLIRTTEIGSKKVSSEYYLNESGEAVKAEGGVIPEGATSFTVTETVSTSKQVAGYTKDNYWVKLGIIGLAGRVNNVAWDAWDNRETKE